jgi:small subunit ribosomal protein S1
VQVLGKAAFCPISQLDLRRVESAQEFVGKKFEFIVTQFENNGRNIVVSRRRVLEQLRAESEGAFLASAKPGDIFRGKIARLERYGAFVELVGAGVGGVEGLIPISELAWGRVNDPGDVVSLGQEVDVALLRAGDEEGRLRVSLSLKQAGGEGDPWTRVGQDFPVGTIVEGEIERREAYGLFVRISPAITGLMPKSKWRDSVDGAHYENRRKGERIKVQVAEIQAGERRITLAPPDDRDDGAWRAHASPGAGVGAGFGTLGDLLKGVAAKKPGPG